MKREEEKEERQKACEGLSVLQLPEGCISNIASLTSPRDACRESAISRQFKSAAESDTVWERFLPPDYRDIIARSASPVAYATKKDLYFRFSESSLLLDGGRLSFSINKCNGKKCFMLAARELSIAWQDNPTYWKWSSSPDSRFSEVALLQAVCWLDIEGKMPTGILSGETTYAAYLVFKLTEDARGFEYPSKASVRLALENSRDDENDADDKDNVKNRSSVCLRGPQNRRGPRGLLRRMGGRHHCRFPNLRPDGWMELELGQFFNSYGGGMVVLMQFKEVEFLNWKSGLIVEGIELRPTGE